MLRYLTALALSAFAFSALAQGQDFSKVEITTEKLNDNTYMLVGAGGNIGLSVGADAVFVIDDQFAPLTPKIAAAIAKLSDKPVKFVINTHWHFDHTGGNENIGKAGALIVAHENVRQRMAVGQFIEAVNRTDPPAVPSALPVVTFTAGVTFHINGDSVVVTHVAPAHTDGDAIVHFTKANVIHTGDVFVSAGLPFVDLSSGGSLNGIIAAAEKIVAMANADTKIIPGHGPIADRARLQAWHDMLVVLRDRVRADVAAGRTVEQLLAANITAPYAKDWPGGHERFLRIAHQELARR